MHPKSTNLQLLARSAARARKTLASKPPAPAMLLQRGVAGRAPAASRQARQSRRSQARGRPACAASSADAQEAGAGDVAVSCVVLGVGQRGASCVESLCRAASGLPSRGVVFATAAESARSPRSLETGLRAVCWLHRLSGTVSGPHILKPADAHSATHRRRATQLTRLASRELYIAAPNQAL